MYKIYSKVDGSLLHCIVRSHDIINERLDVSPEDEFLQLAGLKLLAGKKFRAHKHILCNKIVTMPAESWVCISGIVKLYHYDLDDTLISEQFLYPGDVSITYRGGHNYEIIEDGIFWEFKTPNYTGQLEDKVFINV